MSKEPVRHTVEPRALDEGTIGLLGASDSAEHEALNPDRAHAFAVVMVELVANIPDPRDRAAVQMCVMERISYAEAGELLAADLGYAPDAKTVWRWAQRGLEWVAEVVRTTPWLTELAPHLPLTHPVPPTAEPPTFQERLTQEAGHGESAEEEGHRTRDRDGAEG